MLATLQMICLKKKWDKTLGEKLSQHAFISISSVPTKLVSFGAQREPLDQKSAVIIFLYQQRSV